MNVLMHLVQHDREEGEEENEKIEVEDRGGEETGIQSPNPCHSIKYSNHSLINLIMNGLIYSQSWEL